MLESFKKCSHGEKAILQSVRYDCVMRIVSRSVRDTGEPGTKYWANATYFSPTFRVCMRGLDPTQVLVL